MGSATAYNYTARNKQMSNCKVLVITKIDTWRQPIDDIEHQETQD